MPVVLDFGSGRIKVSIYFQDHDPPHVHVRAPGAEARFEIETGRCIEADGFSKAALTKIGKFLMQRKDFLKEKWDEYQEA